MSDAPPPRIARREINNRVGGWFALAAAPTFALMALGSARFGGAPEMVCMAARGSSWISEMTVMYLMMSAAHLTPWLRLLARQSGEAVRPADSRTTDALPLAGEG